MDPHQAFCPNLDCPARGQRDRGNIVLHSRRPQRYRCTLCHQTFTPSQGTVFYRAHTAPDLMVLVLTLLAHGCPVAAIEAAFGLQRRTVRRWQQVAGNHCQAVHQHLVVQPQPRGQVQADELRVRLQQPRGRGGVLWVAMAIAVPTRLWLGAVLHPRRDKALLRAVAALIRACVPAGPLLVAVDGLPGYGAALARVFRTRVRHPVTQRLRFVPWKQVVIGRVVKQYGKGHGGRHTVVGVRRLVQGSHRLLRQLLRATQDKNDGGVLNTAYIERLNATFRARWGPLVRRTRGLLRSAATLQAGLYLVGSVYNFCSGPASLAQAGRVRTPAMAAGLTEHVWSVRELLCYQVPPPPWAPPRRCGRRSKAMQALLERWVL